MSNHFGISRAFTKRSKQPEISGPIMAGETHFNHAGHIGNAKKPSGSIKRGKISAPMELLSTTNMLAYNAPDLRSVSSSSSSSSLRSAGSDTMNSYPSPITSSGSSSMDQSPILAEPNHLSSYFHQPKRSATVTSSVRSSTSSGGDAPAIPQRALSHTKRSHQDLARQRSISKMAPPPTSISQPASVRHSQDMFRPGLLENSSHAHPFGKELEQVNEVAEDFGGVHLVLDEEEQLLLNKGLRKFTVDDYLMEIEEVYGNVFEDRLPNFGSAWI